MKINPESWRLFFKEDEKVLAIPSWVMPRVYFPNRTARQRWRDAGALYPALRLRSKMLRFSFQATAALFPYWFIRRALPVTGRKAGRFREACVALVRRIRVLRHSALFQALFPEAYGLTPLVPGAVAHYQYSLNEWIEKLPEFDHAVVMVGAAADEKQKMIIRMVSRSGRVLAYLKYAEQPLALEKVENERRVLSAILPGMGPAILKAGPMGIGKALLMTPVAGQPLPSRMPSDQGVYGWQRINSFLKQLSTESLFDVQSHPAVARLRRWMETDAGIQTRGIGLQEFDEILKPLRRHQWPVVVQHGDLTPWNLYSQKGHLAAVDWEDGALDGFPGFDQVHFGIQTGYFFHHWSAGQTARVAERSLKDSFGSPDREAIVKLGALDAYVRGQADGLPDCHPLQRFRLEIVKQEFGA